MVYLPGRLQVITVAVLSARSPGGKMFTPGEVAKYFTALPLNWVGFMTTKDPGWP
jgi:hypothetical protein